MSERLFGIHIPTEQGNIIVTAFDTHDVGSMGHSRLDIEVKHAGKVVFARGSLWVGIPSHASIDGSYAKETVLSCVQMKPGDTDAEYFDSYSPEQLAWAIEWSDTVSICRESRYCDRNGNPKRSLR